MIGHLEAGRAPRALREDYGWSIRIRLFSSFTNYFFYRASSSFPIDRDHPEFCDEPPKHWNHQQFPFHYDNWIRENCVNGQGFPNRLMVRGDEYLAARYVFQSLDQMVHAGDMF
jgi:hypothetical protein